MVEGRESDPQDDEAPPRPPHSVSSFSPPKCSAPFSNLRVLVTDARTEWSIRWTAATVASYALLFYVPQTSSWSYAVDWTLPVQLLQGGAFSFYNVGFHNWFGFWCAHSLVLAGCLLSVIYTLIATNRLVAAYFSLMALLCALVLPCAVHLGALSSQTGLAVLVAVVLLEFIYVPALNLYPVLPDVASVWIELVRPTVFGSLVYVALSWGMYVMPPPWHSGTTQSLRMACGVAGALSAALEGAAGVIEGLGREDHENQDGHGTNGNENHDGSNDGSNDVDEGHQKGRDDHNEELTIDAEDATPNGKAQRQPNSSHGSKTLLPAHRSDATIKKKQALLCQLGSTVFRQTNRAGMAVPITLYGDVGSFEWSILYPCTSFDTEILKDLAQKTDEAALHISLVIWLLGHTDALLACVGTSALRDGNDERGGKTKAEEARRDAKLRKALVEHLRSSSLLAEATSSLLAVQRRSAARYKKQLMEEITSNDLTTADRKRDVREGLVLRGKLWGFDGVASDTWTALSNLHKARGRACRAGQALREEVVLAHRNHRSEGEVTDHPAVLWTIARDTTVGSRPLRRMPGDSADAAAIRPKEKVSVRTTSTNTAEEKVLDKAIGVESTEIEGTLGRLADAAEVQQTSWDDHMAVPRQFCRMSMLMQWWDLIHAWCHGMSHVASFMRACAIDLRPRQRHRGEEQPPSIESPLRQQQSHLPPLIQRRGFRRAVQWLIGTCGLYAMVTFWESFRSLLGSSMAGPWTLVAFYCCFRPTVEETVHVAILRSIGQGLGALLGWAVNAHVLSSGGRIAVNAMVTLVLTWFIPPPFVYPTSINLGVWDNIVGTGLFEGALTTYHLTSSIVLGVDPASAAKARATSQCIGSAAAAAVSVIVLPWWANAEAKIALEGFLEAARQAVKIVVIRDTWRDDGGACVVGSCNNDQTTAVREDLNKLEVDDALQDLKASINKLLHALKDFSAVLEANWIGSLLQGLGRSPSENANVQFKEKLLDTILGGYALEGTLVRLASVRVIPTETREAFRAGDGRRAAQAVLDIEPPANGRPQYDIDEFLATCHANIIIMTETGLFESLEVTVTNEVDHDADSDKENDDKN